MADYRGIRSGENRRICQEEFLIGIMQNPQKYKSASRSNWGGSLVTTCLSL
jgi:hypothetical protein